MKIAIVFVQIGNPIPKYAIENIKRTTRQFGENQFILVVDDNVFESIPDDFKLIRNLDIFISDFARTELSLNVNSNDFRQGFWHYTKIRLCTLRELHRNYPQVSLLHIENDVLLLPDFQSFTFDHIKLTSWLTHTEQDDSGAVLFSPTVSSTENFIERFIAEIESEETNSDMRILNRLRKSFPSEFGVLPTLNSSELTQQEVFSGEHSINKESGFDPAFLGIWMYGDDARNRFGLSKRYTFLGRGRVLIPELLDFDSKESRLLFGLRKQKTKVLSIHVHNKTVELFSERWTNEIVKAILLSRIGKPQWNFSLKILFEVLSDYKRRGKLHTLVTVVPIIGKVIRKFRSNAF